MNREPSDSGSSLQPPASSPGYSAFVVEHFEHPRNVGRLPAGPGVVETTVGEMEAGAQIRLSLRFDGDRVMDAKFQAYGCPHFLAAASALTEQLPGRTREDLERYTWRDLPAELEIPVEKRGRLLILEDAVHAAAQ